MPRSTYDFAISRRTMAKGAAWSVPAVAVAAFAPAAASLSLFPKAVWFTRATGCVINVGWAGTPEHTYEVQYKTQASDGTLSDWTSSSSPSTPNRGPRSLVKRCP